MLYRVMVFFALVVAVVTLFLVVLLVSHCALVSFKHGVAHLVLEHGELICLTEVIACKRPKVSRLCGVVQRLGFKHFRHLRAVIAVKSGLCIVSAHICFVRHQRVCGYGFARRQDKRGGHNYRHHCSHREQSGFFAVEFTGLFRIHNFPVLRFIG